MSLKFGSCVSLTFTDETAPKPSTQDSWFRSWMRLKVGMVLSKKKERTTTGERLSTRRRAHELSPTMLSTFFASSRATHGR